MACTKTVILKEDQPVQVTASPPAPPPEPPPPPPEPPPKVEVKKERIQVNETIEFEYNKAVIRPESNDLMAEIAKVMNDHPEILEIRIEGHTDNVGSKKFNMKLSLRRAQAVRDHLVNQGKVDGSRLEVAGFGFDRPIASNDTDEGRAQNRRVAFEITKRAPEGDDTADESSGDAETDTEGGGGDETDATSSSEGGV
jgi:OOP family OmpA-OmpF porin